MKTKAVLSVSFLTVAALIITLPSPVSWAQKPIHEVVVGNISAMTGPTSGTHLMCQSGSKDYLYYLNEKGGIEGKKGKVKVKYLSYDSQYVAAKAKDGFARLESQGMIVLTHCASAHSDALMSDYESAKIPLVTGNIGVASVWSDWCYGNYYPGGMNSIGTWVLWQKNNWIKAGKPGGTLVLGTLASDEPWVPLSLWGFDAFVKEQGIKMVIETIPKGTTDASPQLLRLRDAGVKAIHILTSAPGVVIVLRSAKSMGLKIPFTISGGTNLGDVVALGGADLADGLIGGYFYWPMSASTKLKVSTGGKLARELWQKNHPNQKPSDMYINGILSGMIIAEGLRKALDEVTPEALNGEALKKYGLDRIKDFDCMGLTTPITYVSGDHMGQKHVKYWEVRKGGDTYPITDWIPMLTFRIPKK